MKQERRKLLVRGLIAAALLAGLALVAWIELRPDGLGEGFASGNGRLEATEIDVATKLAGRIAAIAVDEGDFVQPGQILARMDTQTLDAQLNQARAQVRQAENAILTARARVAQRQSEEASAAAVVEQQIGRAH
ncbi:biotin/lipoyl-binding protein, partial [Azotobacter beijerinckii]|uniref:biotin/lipoyl-binding protein n=1 Tax=Azotobacter beijerinckii TaxID=170623 RepID=UPI00295476DE